MKVSSYRWNYVFCNFMTTCERGFIKNMKHSIKIKIDLTNCFGRLVSNFCLPRSDIYTFACPISTSPPPSLVITIYKIAQAVAKMNSDTSKPYNHI